MMMMMMMMILNSETIFSLQPGDSNTCALWSMQSNFLVIIQTCCHSLWPALGSLAHLHAPWVLWVEWVHPSLWGRPCPSPASTFPTTIFVTHYYGHDISCLFPWLDFAFCERRGDFVVGVSIFCLKDGIQYMWWMAKYGQSPFQALKHGNWL